MKYKVLGRNTGLRVSEFSLGAGRFGEMAPLGLGRSAARAIFDAYAEAGGNFIDTAAGYQAGQSEALIGEFVGAERDSFVIGTKYSIGTRRDEHYAVKGNGRKAMMISVDASLRRLSTDYIDVLWLHGEDAVTPMDEILRGLDDLVRAGKILHAGFSNFPAWRISRGALWADVRRYAPLSCIQIEYSAAERSADRELVPMAEALGLGVVLWSVLGGGYLAGERPSILTHWTVLGRPRPRDAAVLETIRRIAAETGSKPALVALAWLLDRFARSVTANIPIIGAETAGHLRELVEVRSLALARAHLDAVTEAGAPCLGEPHDHNAISKPIFDGGDHFPIPVPVA